MQRTILACAMAGLMISGMALGQGSSIPTEVQGNYARLKANILKAADKMPAQKYAKYLLRMSTTRCWMIQQAREACTR